VIKPALLDEMRLKRALVGDGIFVADNGREAGEKIGGEWFRQHRHFNRI
jgi:hypothetical protein